MSDGSFRPPSRLAEQSLEELCRRLSERTPTPGGGSASAATGAMGSALGEMVLRYSQTTEPPDPEIQGAIAELAALRIALLRAVDDDSEAFERLRTARKV
ncbi:MAG TPA: cyclodeaminase/cyclohydrolase family protein, partial [Thermoplasmata archaeon]|nr:cyclodeaminase/cyclohydrolase family protein [Thermoplasmata archaeon]